MTNLAHVKSCEFRETLTETILSEVPVNGYPAYRVNRAGYVIGARNKPLAVDCNSGGYQRVSLCKDGIVKRVFVHRLVAEHFVSNPNGHRYVNHIDGNRINNDASNLEWCTASYNVNDGWKRGRLHPFTGKRATTILNGVEPSGSKRTTQQ